MVLGRVAVGVGVTMFFSDAPFADGGGDDSAVLGSKTSPEGGKKGNLFTSSHKKTSQKKNTHVPILSL